MWRQATVIRHIHARIHSSRKKRSKSLQRPHMTWTGYENVPVNTAQAPQLMRGSRDLGGLWTHTFELVKVIWRRVHSRIVIIVQRHLENKRKIKTRRKFKQPAQPSSQGLSSFLLASGEGKKRYPGNEVGNQGWSKTSIKSLARHPDMSAVSWILCRHSTVLNCADKPSLCSELVKSN